MGKMIKSIKDRESELFNQRGYIRNTWSMKGLYAMPCLKILEEENNDRMDF